MIKNQETIESLSYTIIPHATIRTPSQDGCTHVKVNQIVASNKLVEDDRGLGQALVPHISDDESVNFKSHAIRRFGKEKRPPAKALSQKTI